MYIVSVGVSPGSKLCTTFLNIAKHFKTIGCGYGSDAVPFSNLLNERKECMQETHHTQQTTIRTAQNQAIEKTRMYMNIS